MPTPQPASSASPSPNLVIAYRASDGGTAKFCPTPLILKWLRGGFEPGLEQLWFGTGDRDDCLCVTDDGRWILFYIDRSSLLESFGEGSAEQVAAREDRELTAHEAADWLDRNGDMLPKSLMGRSLEPDRSQEAHGQSPASRSDIDRPAPKDGARAPKLNPASRALGAAHQLLGEGKSVSVSAACRLAGVDRHNLKKSYPRMVAIIKELAKPDQSPKRGFRDRKTGSVDAQYDQDE